ncbi:putative 4-mercaptohistidine N1-methyltranferase [Rubritalea squalenifaciens DSM 18772]|uniref:Putative 4-mercaptohistidine N1-methyltranferase n=1 Tax=Rubritalea squalenifaciens DSM 18772 TaxID=1123071 RepID=A0A1M6H376_9BACT|nr:putative 4-mercaptohistidine N1-methyltransferase [Rubritalea squalenifaciens]SHJ16653.1 putative 4-mercaptohistidine N1-methyltranferase [Rubritalea squalenifaciens DSM 18772]
MVQDYESEKLLNEYLLMHYGTHEELMPWGVGSLAAHDFVSRTVTYFSPKPVRLSLDLGCAVGKTSFLLSQSSQKVIGIDFSQNFIDAANVMKEKGSMPFRYQEEGDIYTESVARLPENVMPERVSFAQGDALNLPEGFKGFDRVHASNLLCRLPDPEKLLERLPSLLADSGEVVFATPFSWLEQYTPKEKWPQGDSWEWLKGIMEKNFTLIQDADEPFLIREHARKFQLGISKISAWKKK